MNVNIYGLLTYSAIAVTAGVCGVAHEPGIDEQPVVDKRSRSTYSDQQREFSSDMNRRKHGLTKSSKILGLEMNHTDTYENSCCAPGVGRQR